MHALTTVTRVSPLAGGGYEVQTRRTGRRSDGARPSPPAGRLRRRHLRHPASAAQDEGRGPPARAFAAAGRAHPDELRVDPQRPRRWQGHRLQRGRRDHLVDPPHSGHAHRTGPLRQGLQRDGHAADLHDRRRLAHAALGTVPRLHGPASARHPPVGAPKVVGADGDPARHAVTGQLDHRAHQAGPHRPAQDDLHTGPRRAEPDVDPDRKRSRTAHRRARSTASRWACGATWSTSR